MERWERFLTIWQRWLTIISIACLSLVILFVVGASIQVVFF